jgi:hypothetical protein
MTATGSHPDLLGFVAGFLTAAQEADVAAHLRGCEACRDEERSLRSLRRSLRAAPAGVHPSVEDLVAFEEAAAGGPRAPDRSAGDDPLAAHLAACAECRADLATLAEARRRRHALEPQDVGSTASSGRPRTSRRVRIGLAAAACMTGALVAAGLFVGRQAPPARFTATLSPPARGGNGETSLVTGERATLLVVLPFGSPGGRYEARLEAESGQVIGRAETRVLKDGETLEVLLDAPAQAGSCRLALTPLDGRVETPFLYPLRVSERR